MPMFCPRCGTLMRREGSKLVCPKCGYTIELNNVEKKTISFQESKSNSLFTENRQKYPIVKVKCPRCGNDTAYVIVQQTRSADEAPTRIFKCTKCGYVWREYE